MVREVMRLAQGHTGSPAMRSQSLRSLEDLTRSFPRHKKGRETRSPLVPPNTGLAGSVLSSTEGHQAGCSEAGRVENPTQLHLPSQQSSCQGAGASARLEPGAQGPAKPPAARKGSWPPPLSHLQAGDRRDSGPDNSSFFAQAFRQGTTPAFPLGIP